ncbi:MAG: WD40 repeat domain-containing protein [Chloroflexi bacterium]|nr:WD40 repeat domain-containing protein [Chloroflexota bacterium]
MTRKRAVSLIFFVLLACVSVSFGVAAQGQTPAYTVQVIPVEGLPALDFKVSPDGRFAAVYVGNNAAVLAGVPVIEYTVDPSAIPIRLIDLATGDEQIRLVGAADYVADAAFSPDGSRLVVYHRNGEVYVWELESFTLENQFTALVGANVIKLLGDGKTLVVLHGFGTWGEFHVWDLETGHLTAVWRPPLASFGELPLSDVMAMGDYNYTAFDVSPEGNTLALATRNGEVALWDMTTFEKQPVRAEDERPLLFNVRNVRFSADGKSLVYYDGALESTHIWNIASGSETLVVPVGAVSAALSPNGEWLAWTTREALQVVRIDQPDKVIEIAADISEDLSLNPVAPVVFTSDNQLVVGSYFDRGELGYTVLLVINLFD